MRASFNDARDLVSSVSAIDLCLLCFAAHDLLYCWDHEDSQVFVRQAAFLVFSVSVVQHDSFFPQPREEFSVMGPSSSSEKHVLSGLAGGLTGVWESY